MGAAGTHAQICVLACLGKLREEKKEEKKRTKGTSEDFKNIPLVRVSELYNNTALFWTGRLLHLERNWVLIDFRH